ncbi:MAG: hypothetical protein LBV12_08100 [Puniceicoccales bacterium]|jgi:hypothetical protein|nr:hypothetical protein [Puniceicoccales bacterium]
MNLIYHPDNIRPKKLFRYSERKWLERSLSLGEFRLRPASHYRDIETALARSDDEQTWTYSLAPSSVKITNTRTGQSIIPIEEVTFIDQISTDFLVLCMASQSNECLFRDFSADSCLIIHNPEEFCERIYKATDTILKEWTGLDAKVTYGIKSFFGVVFTKHSRFANQFEWRFAWCPPDPRVTINEPVMISIGSIEKIAEIVDAPSMQR